MFNINTKRKKPKLIGLLTAWGAAEWIEPAITQGLEYCDELHVAVVPLSEELRQFEDETLNIAKKFNIKHLYSRFPLEFARRKNRCQLLNYMLSKSQYYEKDNWIWILDADEFYPESLYHKTRTVISSGKYDIIDISSMFFFINMHHYLKISHRRLFKIELWNLIPFSRFRFTPTQHWFPDFTRFRKILRIRQTSWDNLMFHYSLLINPHLRNAQWGGDLPDTKVKIQWLNEIYRNYEPNNSAYWNNLNHQITGFKSIAFGSNQEPDQEGNLFKYDGKHPKFIEQTSLPHIPDFREYYGFK